LSTRKVEKIGKVAGFGLNSRKSLRKAKPSFGYFRALWALSGIAEENGRKKEERRNNFNFFGKKKEEENRQFQMVR